MALRLSIWLLFYLNLFYLTLERYEVMKPNLNVMSFIYIILPLQINIHNNRGSSSIPNQSTNSVHLKPHFKLTSYIILAGKLTINKFNELMRLSRSALYGWSV